MRDRLRSILSLDDPPHKLALAFALGVFVAFSPTLGLHVISCLALGWLFRLNKLVILTASFINNPWTMVPLYGFCIWLGFKITGSDATVPQIAWKEITPANSYAVLKPFLWSYVAGTLVAGTVAAFVSYYLFYKVVVRYRKTVKS
ncbi:MAG TPA: DUF2062 domain-containing protein [Nitrospirota bacterium]|nr:DUF2062 domain-containing protein [Nitrospirota bacterium]